VAELALVAAGLGLVVYLLGFVADIDLGTLLHGPLLVGGGLLAGSVVLPAVGTRVLVPAAIATVTGALLLLQVVAGGADSALAVGALVLALLEAAATAGAALLHAGVLRAPKPKPKKQAAATPPAFAGHPPQPGPVFPGQQYPGQPYPGPYPGYPGEQYPGDQYAGEHAYAQNARYGGSYGVPGYPPPPPYGAPGFDPAAYGGQPAYGRPDAPDGPTSDEQMTAAVPAGDVRPPADAASRDGETAEPASSGTGSFPAGSRSEGGAGAEVASGSFRASGRRSEGSGPESAGGSAAEPASAGSGSFRAPGRWSERSGAETADPGPAGSGAFRTAARWPESPAAEPSAASGSFRSASGRWPESADPRAAESSAESSAESAAQLFRAGSAGRWSDGAAAESAGSSASSTAVAGQRPDGPGAPYGRATAPEAGTARHSRPAAEAERDDAGEHTHVIPTVPDER
jgi:hypothetical protein